MLTFEAYVAWCNEKGLKPCSAASLLEFVSQLETS